MYRVIGKNQICKYFFVSVLIFLYTSASFNKPLFEIFHVLSHIPEIVQLDFLFHSVDHHNTENHSHKNLETAYIIFSSETNSSIPHSESTVTIDLDLNKHISNSYYFYYLHISYHPLKLYNSNKIKWLLYGPETPPPIS